MPADSFCPSRPPRPRFRMLNGILGPLTGARWSALKLRCWHQPNGAKLRTSIWVRNVRKRSKRVFLCR